MKRYKNAISVAIALMLCISMGLSIAGCTASKKDRKNKNDKKYEDDEDDDSEEDDEEDKPSKPAYSYVAVAEAPDSYDELTERELAGVWVDECGIYFEYDSHDNILYDSYGVMYEVGEVRSDGILIEEFYDSEELYQEIVTVMPIPKSFFLPMYLCDGCLHVGNNELYRADSDKGIELCKKFADRLTEISLVSEGDYSVVFHKDGTFTSSEDDELGYWEYEEGILELTYDDEPVDTYIRELSEGNYVMMSYDEDGCYLMADSDAAVTKSLCDDYIYWYLDDNSVEYLTITETEFQYSAMTKNPYVDIETYEFEEYEFEEAFFYFMKDDYSTTIFGTPGFLIVYNDTTFLYDDDSFDLAFRSDTILAQIMLYREDIVNGRKENNIIEDFSMDFEMDNISVSVEFDLEKDWYLDYFNVNFIDDDSYKYPYSYSDDYFDYVGPAVYVDVKQPLEMYTVTYTVPLHDGDNPDNYAVMFSDTNDFIFLSTDLLSEECVETETTNDSLIITCTFDESMGFIVTDASDFKGRMERVTTETILTTDPHDSNWAYYYEDCTGDILDLVDLDYIAESIVDENGTAVFWVSTPEELASATYYINEIDLEDQDIETMFYIHLLNDIDLEGYRWAPLGSSANDSHAPGALYQHMMQGIIFGNGYSIKNLSIDPNVDAGFVDDCHLLTIIGLTLENPYIDWGICDYLVGSYSCITEVFDCKVKLYDEYFNEEYQSFGAYDNLSVIYVDCEYTNTDPSTGETEDQDMSMYSSEFYNGYDNWVYRYYYNEKTGKYEYDASSEYEDYLNNPEGFITGQYYYDDGSETPEEHHGYLDFYGYMYGDEFMVNYGSIRTRNG